MNGSEGRRVFVAGATGAIGRVLVPKLVAAGHDVTAMTRSESKLDAIRASIGAKPVLCDVFDHERLCEIVTKARPDVVINQLTDLPRHGLKPRKLPEYYARNDRVRREGTRNLLSAARSAGAERYIGQSGAFFYAPEGTGAKAEEDSLWHDAPSPFREAVDALAQSEQMAIDAPEIDAIVLRFGNFYGPNTWYSRDGDIGRQVSKRQYPLIGSGQGITSFVEIGDAADVCIAFIDRGQPGIYNVVDDEPAAAAEWLPAFAEAIGAKSPRRVPVWLARIVAGRAIVEWSTRSPAVSNDKLKRELGWEPSYRSWRQGFRQVIS